MPHCSALGCFNRSSRKTKKQEQIEKVRKIHFHLFPTSPGRREAWIKAVGLPNDWKPDNSNFICSEHFTDDCFDYTSLNVVRLREHAVPTVFETCSAEIEVLDEANISNNNSTKSTVSLEKKDVIVQSLSNLLDEEPNNESESECEVEVIGEFSNDDTIEEEARKKLTALNKNELALLVRKPSATVAEAAESKVKKEKTDISSGSVSGIIKKAAQPTYILVKKQLLANHLSQINEYVKKNVDTIKSARSENRLMVIDDVILDDKANEQPAAKRQKYDIGSDSNAATEKDPLAISTTDANKTKNKIAPISVNPCCIRKLSAVEKPIDPASLKQLNEKEKEELYSRINEVIKMNAMVSDQGIVYSGMHATIQNLVGNYSNHIGCSLSHALFSNQQLKLHNLNLRRKLVQVYHKCKKTEAQYLELKDLLLMLVKKKGKGYFSLKYLLENEAANNSVEEVSVNCDVVFDENVDIGNDSKYNVQTLDDVQFNED